jgi:hypothetical protein
MKTSSTLATTALAGVISIGLMGASSEAMAKKFENAPASPKRARMTARPRIQPIPPVLAPLLLTTRKMPGFSYSGARATRSLVAR